MNADVVTKLADLIVDRGLTERKRNEIMPTSDLRQELGLDSLKMVEFIVLIEEQFELVFDDSSLNRDDFTTLDSVAKLIRSLADGR